MSDDAHNDEAVDSPDTAELSDTQLEQAAGGLTKATFRRVGNWRGGPSGPGLAVSGVSPFVPG